MLALGYSQHPDARALYDAHEGRWWTYAELDAGVTVAARSLRAESKALVFDYCRNRAGSTIAYLGALRAGHAVALLDGAASPAVRAALTEAYEPEFIAGYDDGHAPNGYVPAGDLPGGVRLWRRIERSASEVAPELGVLLTTSGSTGSPKLVRLSGRNVAANAESIRTALDITASQRALASLPIFYSYGLSVLNSHLAAGASVVLTDDSVLTPAIWELCRDLECTSLAGVPYTYQLLERIGFRSFELPSVATMTQAGGKLGPELVDRYHAHMRARAGRFFVMYGQTEATARMTVLPDTALPAKRGSVGIAIPGGRIDVEASGEVVYRGPNVMLGYATGRADLARGDDLAGALHTGDVGYLDDDGYLYLTGRSSRIAKLFGIRLNLDEVQALVAGHGPTAAVQDDERLVLYCEWGDEAQFATTRTALARSLCINHRALVFERVETLPYTASGKVDYSALVSH